MGQKQQIRKRFNEQCARRDKWRCACCKTQICDHLATHHITNREEMPFGGYVKENGITLCDDCHWKAEEWHRSGHTNWVPGYHPNDLYKIIGSSYEEALEASKKL